MKSKKNNFLVTGVGAVIGYGILRQLRELDDNYNLIGVDVYSDAVGQAWCNSFEQAPYTSSCNYLSWLKSIVLKYNIELIFLGIEQDLYFLVDHVDELRSIGCELVLNNPSLIKMTYDKWLIYEELRVNDDISLIPTRLTGRYEDIVSDFGLPFLLKPRSSYASKGIVKVTKPEEFYLYQSELGHNLMIQPIVGSSDEEYTVSVFGNGEGSYSALIVLKRILASDGSTAKARVIRPTKELLSTLKRLCKYFKPVGPTNFQFRKDEIIWYLLEINARISSSSSLRAAFGFSEVKMCIDFYLYKVFPEQPTIKSGFAARFIEDYITYDGNNL